MSQSSVPTGEGTQKTVVATASAPLTPDSRAMLEAAKTLIVTAPETARDTCKFYVTLTSSSVPVYIALLRLLLPEHASLDRASAALLLMPGLLFLGGVVAGARGLRPLTQRFDSNVVEAIDAARTSLVEYRVRAASVAFAFFGAGVLLTIAVAGILLWFLPHL